jgi:hypothetical protein
MDAMIVTASLGLMVCLALPAIQAARESSRATECSNNLKQIMLGLHNYHDTYKTFPSGAMATGGKDQESRMGPAWWFGLLPFIDARKMYDRINATQRARFSPPAVPFNAAGMDDLIDQQPGTSLPAWLNLGTFAPSWMHCPSSPLPLFERADGPIALPTYVGIAGGCDLDPTVSTPESQLPPVGQAYFNRQKGTAPHGGIMTASGMLVPNAFVNFASCSDGLSNTICVGEQSDWLRDVDPNSEAKFHGDPGWDTAGTAGSGPNDGGGFLSGTAVPSRVPPCKQQGTPDTLAPQWDVDCYNVTTVRYGLNLKRVLGDRPRPGCSEDHGVNNPLQSAHPLGAHVAVTDGSVMALSEDVELSVLLRLAIRDDGQNIGDLPRVPPAMFDAAGAADSASLPETTPAASAQAPTAAETAALDFVRAAFLERDADKATSFVAPDAARAGQPAGSIVQNLRQIPQWPSPDVLKLRQIHLFRKQNLEAMEERFPRLTFERVASEIADGLGCHLVFSITRPDGTLRKAHVIFVFREVNGETKIVFQDDGT